MNTTILRRLTPSTSINAALVKQQVAQPPASPQASVGMDMPTWVLPAAVIGGLALIGYFVLGGK